MEPPLHGAPGETQKRSPLKRITNWLGITEDTALQVPSGTYPSYYMGQDGQYHAVQFPTDRSGRPISNPYELNQQGYYAAPAPISVRSAPTHPQQQQQQQPFLFPPPTVRRDYPFHGQTPQAMVTPESPYALAGTPRGTRQLQAELLAAEAAFHNGRTLFAAAPLPRDLRGAVVDVAIDEDEFVDSVAGDESLHIISDGSVSSPSSNISTVTADVNPRDGDTRTKKNYGFIPAVSVSCDGKEINILPSVDGFDHPVTRNPKFTGNDFSFSKGQFLYYVIKEGWVCDIVDTYAAAWVRTADYQDLTKCASYPNGIEPLLKGFNTYKAAVAYLGWDPSIVPAPPRSVDPKPPPRHSRFCRPDLNLGPDPHDWCGTHTMSVTVTINPDGSVTDTTGPTKLSAAYNKRLEEETTALLLAAAAGTRESKQEDGHRRLLDKTNDDTFPKLAASPSIDALHRWYVLVANLLSGPHWKVDNSPLHNLDDTDDASDAFQYRSAALCRGLIGRLTLDDHTDVLDEFADLQAAGHGVHLFHAIHAYLDPQTDQTAMREFSEFCGILQDNGETVKSVSRKIKRAHDRLKKAGFDLGEPAKLLQLVKAVINGAYSGCISFQTFAQDIVQGRTVLKDLDYQQFVDRVHMVMISAELIKDNKAVKVSPSLVARRTDGGQANTNSLIADPWFGATSLDDVSAMHRPIICTNVLDF